MHKQSGGPEKGGRLNFLEQNEPFCCKVFVNRSRFESYVQ